MLLNYAISNIGGITKLPVSTIGIVQELNDTLELCNVSNNGSITLFAK